MNKTIARLKRKLKVYESVAEEAPTKFQKIDIYKKYNQVAEELEKITNIPIPRKQVEKTIKLSTIYHTSADIDFIQLCRLKNHGKTNQETAALLNLSVCTVQKLVATYLQKQYYLIEKKQHLARVDVKRYLELLNAGKSKVDILDDFKLNDPEPLDQTKRTCVRMIYKINEERYATYLKRKEKVQK